MKELVLRSWRVSQAEPSGAHVWFDPTREQLKLFALEPSTEERVANASEGDDYYEGGALDQVKSRLAPGDGLPF